MKVRLLIFTLLLISLRGYGQSCTLSVKVTSSAPAICSGYSVTLNAGVSGGSGSYTYAWSTGETTDNISVNKAGSYTVVVTDKTSGCPPVTASIPVTVSPTPNAPNVKSVAICTGASAHLVATGPGGVYQWYDATGTFKHTGDTYDTDPIAYSQFFYVETTVNGCTSLRTTVGVYVPNKPGHVDATVCYGSPATISVSGGDTYRWYTSATSTDVVYTGPSQSFASLTASAVFYVEADINGCTSPRTVVKATVTSPPKAPVIDKITPVCSGSVVILHATVPAGVVDWYSTPTGGSPIISSVDYTTPALTANATYYVQTTLNDCISPRVAVTVQVNPVPVAPAAQTVSICFGSSAHLTAGTSGIFQWYADAAGKRFLKQSTTFDTPNLTSSVTYYLQTITAGCASTLSPVNVVVGTPVPTPSAIAPLTCYGTSAHLTASPAGGTYQWFKTATDNNILATSEFFDTPPLTATTTYYLQSVAPGGCISSRIAVTVPVLPQVPAPTAADATTCYGSYATLTADGPDGDYSWYDKAVGGTLLHSGKLFNTAPLTANTVFYVQANIDGCISQLTAVKVTVNPLPSNPTITGPGQICSGDNATLTASAAGAATLQWFTQATGGQPIATTNTFVTPALFGNTTYYVQNSNGSCASPNRTAFIVNVNTNVTSFKYPSGTVSKTSTNITPQIFNPSGATFTASPAGLVFVSTTTGEINVVASVPGTYLVTLSNGACGTYTSQLTITDIPKTNFFYNTPFCQDDANPYPQFLPKASGGNFTATPAGLVFIDPNTGQIDLKKSTPSTYTVKNTIPASGNNAEISSTAPVTIDKQVLISAGSNITAPVNTPITLQGSLTGASGAAWSGGLGTFSSITDPHAVYTSGPNEHIATLNFKSTDPPGQCGPKSATVTITYIIPPGAPTAQGASICLGDSAVLKAIAPGGTYSWYADATGGTAIKTGSSFQTPAIFNNTTYYVETFLNGITSPRTAVPVTINTVPVTPVSPDTVNICNGSTAVLKATGSAGTYQWFVKNPAGQLQLVSNNATYETSPLNTNTTYFVQAKSGNCVSPQKQVIVKVNTVPYGTSPLTDFVCSGNPLNYTMTANVASATFLWSRADVTGISNPVNLAQTTSTITESLINTTGNALDVTYVITPLNNGCAGTPFNYVVTVYPTPMVISAKTDTLCYGSPDNYAITFNTTGTAFNWSRALTPGISNAAISGQASTTMREVLYNTTNAPIEVTYVINYKTANCDGIPFNRVVTVDPAINITSPVPDVACSSSPQHYQITSNVPTATFIWRREVIAGISNTAFTGNTSVIDETLVNTSSVPINVVYIISPSAFGCTGAPFVHVVLVNPKPIMPVANSNSPVCVGSTIQLRTPSIANAKYLWTGPNNYTSALQNPNIPATSASSGTYTLYVITNTCSSDAATTVVQVNEPPVSHITGPQTVCSTATAITLTGSVTGGTSTGVWSSNSATGKFSSTNLLPDVVYIPSAQDKAAGSVIISLSSTSKDDCAINTANFNITFTKLPGADAGKNINVCAQETQVQLAGKILIPGGGVWSTSGDGSFTTNQPNAVYVPGSADKKNGFVNLTLHANEPGDCFIATNDMKIIFFKPPILNNEVIRYVLKDKTITLNPSVSDETVKYTWWPNIGISDIHVKNPVITGDVDRTYTLTVTDSLGCVSSSSTLIKTAPVLSVTNAFTPNGDGKNDTWEIPGLAAYENATVDIFNRYGTSVFHSKGYGVPWDGNYNGQPVPPGVYYFIVDTRTDAQHFTGNVTIIR